MSMDAKVERIIWKLILFFFNDTATTEIYTLSLHDALPILYAILDERQAAEAKTRFATQRAAARFDMPFLTDRKSTRLNSSHANISYAVFCLKKKISSLKM